MQTQIHAEFGCDPNFEKRVLDSTPIENQHSFSVKEKGAKSSSP